MVTVVRIGGRYIASIQIRYPKEEYDMHRAPKTIRRPAAPPKTTTIAAERSNRTAGLYPGSNILAFHTIQLGISTRPPLDRVWNLALICASSSSKYCLRRFASATNSEIQANRMTGILGETKTYAGIQDGSKGG